MTCVSGKSKITIGRKILDTNSGKPPVINNKYQALIWQLIQNPSRFSNQDWGREIKCAKEIFDTYPELDFWTSLNLGFYLNSLNFFRKADGRKILNKKITEYRTAMRFGDSSAKDEDKFDNDTKFDKNVKPKEEISYEDFFKRGKKTK